MRLRVVRRYGMLFAACVLQALRRGMRARLCGKRKEPVLKAMSFAKSVKQSAVSTLRREACSCVVCNNGIMRIFRRRGVADLLALLHDEPDFLRGAFVADRIVGKGAAAIMAVAGVGEIYAGVASRAALKLLADEGVRVQAGTLTDTVTDRTGNGICPVERLCAPCRTAAECLPLIEDFVKTITAETQGGGDATA